jgi:5-methylcytosine-specific restriction endonuclease McrA
MSVLVLNSSWAPIKIVEKENAILKLYKGSAKALDGTYQLHDWEQWVDNFSDAEKISKDVIRSATLSVVIPKVIVLTNFKKYIRKKVSLTRKNLYKRDDSTCQYCGKKGQYSDFNIDHVIPLYQKGKTVWTNCVLSCLKCNHKKRNRTPKEAGMKLLRKPFVPNWRSLNQTIIKKHYGDWHELLGDLYWNIELKD